MRKAIALLVTLAFVTAIISLVGILATLSKNAFDNVSQKNFIIQSNIFFRDIREILKTNVGDVNDSTSLYYLTIMPFGIEDKDHDINIDIKIASNSSKININKIIDTNQTINTTYTDSLDYLLVSYNVIDRAFLTALILDTIDTDSEERIFGSEISSHDRFFKNGKIENMAHFQKIIDYYKKMREDPSVDKIPWDKIFSFDNESIDYNHASIDALMFMFKNRTRESLSPRTMGKKEIYTSFEDLKISAEDQAVLEKFKVVFFTPNIICKANMQIGNQSGIISFYYNLSTKEASNLELFY